MAIAMTEADFMDMRESYQGFCTACQKFTRDSTEGDARGYDCPVCEQNTVIGAEEALIDGEIEFCEPEE